MQDGAQAAFPTSFPPRLIPLAYQQHPPLLSRDSLLLTFWGYNPKYYTWISAASRDLLRGQPTAGVTLFKGDLQSLLNSSRCLISVFLQPSSNWARHIGLFGFLWVCQQIVTIHPFTHSSSENRGLQKMTLQMPRGIAGYRPKAPNLGLLCIHHCLYHRTVWYF